MFLDPEEMQAFSGFLSDAMRRSSVVLVNVRRISDGEPVTILGAMVAKESPEGLTITMSPMAEIIGDCTQPRYHPPRTEENPHLMDAEVPEPAPPLVITTEQARMIRADRN